MSTPTHLLRKPVNLKAGFTLIELLTVIGVVAVLAAILIPVVSSTREKANSAKCVSNLKQIYAGMQLYVMNHGGNLPAASRLTNGPDDTSGPTSKWARDLEDYLPQSERAADYSNVWDHEVFVCPTAEDAEGRRGPAYVRMAYNATEALYGLNTAGPGGVSRFTPRRQNSIANPANTLLVHDAKLSGPNGIQANYAANWSQANGDIGQAPEDMTYFSFRHSGRMNVLMADGSVKSVEPVWLESFTSDRWKGLE